MSPTTQHKGYYLIRLSLTVLLTGIVAGIVGALVSFLLHFTQHVAFGYSTHQLISTESFLQGVRAAEPLRRVLALTLCGLVAGIGWWAVYRFAKKLVGINAALKLDKPYMPPLATTFHVCLQVITVGLGSPLGREVAPREMSAMLAGVFSRCFKLTPKDAKIILACGAGAGLAAVYNVPLAGALFTLEVLLVSFEVTCLIPALLTATLASMVAWIGLGNEHQYHIVHITLTASLLVWSVIMGPLLGIAAYGFVKATSFAKSKAPKDSRLIPWALINFVMIGLLSIIFPELLGNGKGPLQLGFDGSLAIQMVAILLAVRFFITLTSLRAGAEGGLLTPGLMHGGLFAILMGAVWNMFFPAIPMAYFAIVGAAGFLAASMSMPLTAIVLVFELTQVNYEALVPILLAVIGSVTVYQALKRLA